MVSEPPNHVQKYIFFDIYGLQRVKLSCDSRFLRAVTSCGSVFKVITLV